MSGSDVIDIVERGGKLLLSPFAGMTVEIRARGDSLVIDDRLVSGPRLEAGDNWVRVAAHAIRKEGRTQARAQPREL